MSRPWFALALLAACSGGDELIPETVDAEVACDTGASRSGAIGPDGGELRLCGARLAVAAGVLADDTEFTITQVEQPEAAPFQRVPAGPAFAFGASVDPLPGLVEIDVPADDAPGYLYLYRHIEGEWFGIEACRAGDGVAGQNVAALGTFAAMRDTVVYPPAANGLGEGTVDAIFDGTARPFTLDADSRGIYEEGPDGGRSLTLYLWYTPPGRGLEVLDLRLAAPAGGEIAVIAASWIDLDGGSYSFIDGLTAGSASATLTGDGAHYTGTIAVTFEGAHELTATVDVTLEPYVFPPGLSCPGEGE